MLSVRTRRVVWYYVNQRLVEILQFGWLFGTRSTCCKILNEYYQSSVLPLPTSSLP